MSAEDRLRERLDTFPRVPLAEYPSPLQHLPRLSAELGRPVYVKRDDGIGPAGGGNKTRKLEYLLAEARESGARKVVTYGGLQSNHARITAAAALGLGLEPHLFYLERRPSQLTGNLLLNELAGARMHFFPARRPRGRRREHGARQPAGAAAGPAARGRALLHTRSAGTAGAGVSATRARPWRSTSRLGHGASRTPGS